ncbi:ABC transporter permease [Actinomadura luteofluorescens]|uniref:Phospholipid/cholesterol/gamma-HCH transport system permease protein n=1 Tax=Actinomadura luteofluorescens TaxID=46163 RepID=A0A7Y9JHZ1_9ACTN|nr:phospholipid/cholesterol/gamma-HCH transport system permease protein [Actinomadura glauciflava]NYD49118.1 phospholipid/cholesterol/gamma-HCH transport system permease protein [Actinomadura luteofluorescens]
MSTPGIGADQRGAGKGGGSSATFRKIGDGAANVAIKEPGRFFALCLDTGRAMFQWPFQWREFIQQAWFIVSVTVVPTMLVAIPFGGVLSLQVGGLIRQLGAQSYTGATAVVAIVREASPLVTSLLVAGAAGSAMCADIGSRKIREEIDAMEVLGINPLHRLVVPRMLACAFVALFLNGLVSVVGLLGGYFFNVMLQGGTPGAYLASFNAIAQLPDLLQAEFKAFVFGITAGLVAAYKGLNAKGGPKGVGDAVNQTVVITFMLLFLENFLISTLYFQFVPSKGM